MKPIGSESSSMLTRRGFLSAAGAGLVIAWRGGAAGAEIPATGPVDDAPFRLYAMDTGLRGPDVPTLEAKVDLLARLGYCGIDYTLDHANLPHLLDLLDARKLELNAVYLSPDLADDPDAALPASIRRLKGRTTRIELAIRSARFKPSDRQGDPQGKRLIEGISDMAADTGPVVSLYPHTGSWIERVDDAVRLSNAIGRKNVGANFNLVHWKWVRQTRPLESVLAEAEPHLFAVTINGLAGNRIVRLDEGDYDLAAFLSLVKKVGYRGAIGLQGYGIPGPSADNLKHSMAKWRELVRG